MEGTDAEFAGELQAGFFAELRDFELAERISESQAGLRDVAVDFGRRIRLNSDVESESLRLSMRKTADGGLG